MPLHPRIRLLLALQERLGTKDVTFPQQRFDDAVQAQRLKWVAIRKGPKVPTREVMVPVDGGAIRVRLYEPEGVPAPRPLHVFFHGGGWCVGDLGTRDPRCATIAVGASCTVASVDYRMAPENAYPVPVDDCDHALQWLVEHAGELDVDPTRVSVGGESAGANLAALVALRARDRGGPALVHQWLDVPGVDLTMSSPSIDRFATGYGLTKADIARFLAAYLRDADPKDPGASPLFADDLSGLPPAFVTTCEFDPLTDEGHAYVERLRDAGVLVEHVHMLGHIHGSFPLTRLLPEARAHEQRAIAALRRAYESVQPAGA